MKIKIKAKTKRKVLMFKKDNINIYSILALIQQHTQKIKTPSMINMSTNQKE